MTNFSIGMIGAGMIAKSHIKCLQKEPRASVTWVCDVNETAARAAAEEFQIPHVSADYKDILADPAVDAVLIATPPFLHAEIFGAALAAGKHVLVEKPLAVTPAQVREMTALAAAHPNQLTLDASCRHARLQPKFPFVKGLIASGKLGQVYYIHHVSLGRGTFIEYNKTARGRWIKSWPAAAHSWIGASTTFRSTWGFWAIRPN
ncbi:MAG TPA: Gfo/Idh/MocA family oxidoreductase [Anaerolineae bacterium]|nr:Gfo/Idh/MocA family oxidoreductase [Anaerolineae bacterium]HQI82960.1 Gfo/Idh/MocA family oxidoreductase [Anaerolineae bacterium]